MKFERAATCLAVAAAATVFFVAGCGGGNQTTVVGVTPKIPQQPATSTFTIVVPQKTTASGRRAPRYVSPSTLSLTIAIDGASPIIIALTPASPGCTTSVAGLTCQASVNTTVGVHTFVLTTYDNVAGPVTGSNALSTNTLSNQNVTAAGPNNFQVALGGIIASIAVTLANLHPNVDIATTIAVSVAALDADGNTIVGTAPYTSPITLTDSDTSGAASLSTTQVQSPATAVTLAYNGSLVPDVTIGASSGTVAASKIQPAVLSVVTDDASVLPADVTYFDVPVPTDLNAGEEDQDALSGQQHTRAPAANRSTSAAQSCALAAGLQPPLAAVPLMVQAPFGELRRNAGIFRAHMGADITTAPGKPVYAAASGTLVRSAQTIPDPNNPKKLFFTGYGRYAVVIAGDGTQTRYAHLSAYAPTPAPAPGVPPKTVPAGFVIGYSGRTGYQNSPNIGSHLHFEYSAGDISVESNRLNPCGAVSRAVGRLGTAGNATTTNVVVDGKTFTPYTDATLALNAHTTALSWYAVTGGPPLDALACGNIVFQDDRPSAANGHPRYLGPFAASAPGPLQTKIVGFLDPGKWSAELGAALPNGRGTCPVPPPPVCSDGNPKFFSPDQTCTTWWTDDATGKPATLTMQGYDPGILVVSGALITLPAGLPRTVSPCGRVHHALDCRHEDRHDGVPRPGNPFGRYVAILQRPDRLESVAAWKLSRAAFSASVRVAALVLRSTRA